MALRQGIQMMGRGADIDPETLAQRQRLAEQLYNNSINPQQPERSWTQGAARLAQALSGAYQQSQVRKDKDIYNQQQSQDMQALASALGGKGIDPSVLSSLHSPGAQSTALGLIQSNAQYERERANKAADMEANTRNQEHMIDYKNKSNPLALEQSKLARYAQIANDPDAPPEIRAQAQQRLTMSKQTITDMSPSRTTVNVDASQKADDAGMRKRKELLEEQAVKKEGEISDTALSAEDSGGRMQMIQKAIESGDINNINTTNLGAGVQKVLARAGLPNDSAALSSYIQAAKQQLIDARKQLAGQGQVSNYEGKLLEATVLQADDTMEAAKAKAFVYQQVYQRQRDLAAIQNEWIKRYGSTTKPSENGKTFRDVVTKMYQSKPLISYADAMQQKQNAASQQVSQPQVGAPQ